MNDAPARPAPPGGSPLVSVLFRQGQQWRQGRGDPVEAILERRPELAGDPEAVLDLIYHERMLRSRRGEVPLLDDYVQRFPHLADPLRIQFEVDRAIQEESTWSSEPAPETDRPADQRDGSPDAWPWAPPGYEVLDELGRGGMGIAYRAWQVGLKRLVALKAIPSLDPADPGGRSRFRTEAEAIGRLQHPHIVQVFEIGEHAGRPYLVLEYVDGGSLAEWLDGTPRPAREAAALIETLARAIDYAHRRGVIHRDLKPSNVLLASPVPEPDASRIDPALSGFTPKITDFGLAKILAEGQAGQTRSGDLLGTPSYMAPEQAGSCGPSPAPEAGGPGTVGPAADIYSLGATLYELLSGRPPFRAETPLQTLHQVVWQEPVAPSRLRPDLPRDLETIVLKCLNKDPQRRYAAADELADDLRRFLDGVPIRARRASATERAWCWSRRNPAVAGLVAALAVVVLGGFAAVTWKWREAERAWEAERRARTEADRRAEQIRRDMDLLMLAHARLQSGDLHVHLGRWAAADADYTEAVRARPDYPAVWNERGVFYTRVGLWELAAADFGRYFRLQEPATGYGWYRHALLRAFVGDRDGYREACTRMLERFHDSGDSLALAQATGACLLAPGSGPEPARLVRMAEEAEAAPMNHGWKRFLLGLAQHRAGQDRPAVQSLREALVTDPGWKDSYVVHPVLAMAHHRLGQAHEARQALDDAAREYERWIRTLSDLGVDIRSIPWASWVEFQTFYREARLLIEGGAPDDPRLQAMRNRALTAIGHSH